LPPSEVAAALSALDADVVSLQEVDVDQPRSGSVDQAGLAATSLGAADWRFAPALVGTPGLVRSWTPSPPVALREADGVARFGVALLSRRPVRRWEVLSLGSGRFALPLRVPDPRTGRVRTFWFPDEPRVALAALLDGVTIVATHLSFAPPTSWRQLKALRQWAAALPGPVVLAGDLNLPGAVAARRAGGRALAKAPTYPGAGPRVQLDHVLALGSTTQGSSSVRSSGASARRLAVGDHRALTVDVHL